MSELRERIARVLYEHEARTHKVLRMVGWDEMCKRPSTGYLYEQADAVIAALGLVESKAVYALDNTPAPFRRYVTPWERVEDDA